MEVAIGFAILAGITVAAVRSRRPRIPPWAVQLLERWEAIAEHAGLAGAKLLEQTLARNEWGWTGRVRLRPGQTIEDATKRVGALDSALGTRQHATRIEPITDRASDILLRVMERDPHEHPINWRGPSLASILDPVTVGLFDTGLPVEVRLAWRMTMVAGLTGSGKSGTLNLLTAEAVAAPDAHVWGLDLKRGVELGPWRACLGQLATTPETGQELLCAGQRVIDARLEWMERKGLKAWPVSPEHPALVLVVDEQARVARAGKELLEPEEDITETGRAAGVWLIWAIQRPTQDNLGSDTIRQQSGNRLCHRMKELRDADLAFGQGASSSGWHPHRLGRPGTFLIQAEDQGHLVPRPARAWRVTDKMIEQLVREHASRQPRLDAVSRAAAKGTV